MKTDWKTVTDEKTAFERCGLDFDKLPSFDHYPEWYRKRAMADFVLCTGARAINTDENGNVWQPDWTDGTPKYFVGVWIEGTKEKSSGGRIDGADYDYCYSYSNVGSLLVFPTAEKRNHFYETFKKYQEYWHLN